ncbi:MAG: DUF4105 domain-containing protein, partial [Bacteroidaceae bacterium]|nr:DUF4105 domain-containing protein [Bacteroidaceae bacterium]
TENRKPENRGYRYNFLYDNCSTRPRDIIEFVVDGKLVWQKENVSSTYRGLLHECNSPWPWSSLGVDLVLGQAADEQITQREQEFLPVYLQHHLDAAKIQDLDGNVRPAIANTIVFPAIAMMDDSAEFFLSPIQCILLLLLFVSLLSVLEFKRHAVYWGVDVLLLSAQGIAGILITILFFFSEHPTVNSNWLLWVFNPIPLLYVPVMIYQRIKQHKDPFQIFQAGWLFLFVVSSAFIPQDLPSEAIWAAVVLLIRSISHLSHDYLIQTKRAHNER